jgi:hypothetical protein
MFDADVQQLDRGLKHLVFRQGGVPLSVAEAAEAWQRREDFRSFFTSLLADSPFRVFRWETPPITGATLGRDFEFVLIDSPGIDLPPDPEPFSGHFAAHPDRDVIVFPNLGHDAEMVVPLPRGPHSAYGHLAAFIRNAPREQVHALWRTVGETLPLLAGRRPVWLSTAGGGVAWLHVRFDSWPKYYAHTPYRHWEG